MRESGSPDTPGAGNLSRADFTRHVHDALAHLYDLPYLQNHPLAETGPFAQESGKALQRALTEAIESLKPDRSVALDSHARRGYQVLTLRFVEGLQVEAVAERLAISRAQCLRDQRMAVQAIVSLLWSKWGLAEGSSEPTPAPVSAERGAAEPPAPTPAGADDAGDKVPIAKAPRHNLPLQLTSFVGRERELADVRRLLETTRLLTLTGSGGCGKTRLAFEVASDVVTDATERYPDGVWVVEFAALADPSLVPQVVATALGVHEQAGVPIEKTLLGAIGQRQLMVILDNCEHLVDTVARLASALLQGCPGLRLLATSREPLRLPGEVTWRVPSLSTPDPDRLEALGPQLASTVSGYDSVRLFVGRASAAQPGFALDERNASAVARLCQRLDGIPLAIELAATRVRGLGVEQILARLDQPFSLLAGGSRSALPRQQTLRAALDWSYELLSKDERLLLRRLAAFGGEFTLEAAEAIGACQASSGGAELASRDLLDLLLSLVDRSLVVAEDAGGNARYRLLQTIAQYALEKLVASGEEAAVRAEHAAYFLSLVEQAKPEVTGPREREWLDRLEVEQDNLRAALRWFEGVGDAESGLRMAVVLDALWMQRGLYSEATGWVQALLELPGARETALGVEALSKLSEYAGITSGSEAARRIAEEALTIARRLGDRAALAWAHWAMGLVELGVDPEAATRHWEEAREAFRDVGNQPYFAICLLNLADVGSDRGELAAARRYGEESLEVLRELGAPWPVGMSLARLGKVTSLQGDLARAWELADESRMRLLESGDRTFLTWPTLVQATVLRLQGEYERASELAEEALSRAVAFGDLEQRAEALAEAGLIASARGDLELAQRRLSQSLATAREEKHREHIAAALGHLGLVARARGDDGEASRLLTESLEMHRQLGTRLWEALCLGNLGVVALHDGKLDEARALFAECLRLRRQMGTWTGIATSLECFGGLAALEGRSVRALRLLAAGGRVRESTGNVPPPVWRRERDGWVEQARGQADSVESDAAWAEGQAMTLGVAVEYALEVVSS